MSRGLGTGYVRTCVKSILVKDSRLWQHNLSTYWQQHQTTQPSEQENYILQEMLHIHDAL